MSLLSIRLYPDPVLRVRCPEVETFDAELELLVKNMVETMYAAPGVGLAAPQVGVESRVAVVDATVGEEPGNLLVLINPRILSTQGSEVDVEGCLSIPDITDKVERPAAVSVSAFDAQGREQLIEAEGLEARAIQHEIDHLDGVLFTDHLNGLRKERARRRLRRLRDEVTELAS
jgi:peptide deformylase